MTVTTALLVDEIRKHDDGRVDLLGLYEDIYLPELPVTLESLQVFVDLDIDDADRGRRCELDLVVVDPNGAPLQEPSRIRFPVPTYAQYPRSSAQLDLAVFQIPFRLAGPHEIQVRVAGTVVRRIPLHVMVQDA